MEHKMLKTQIPENRRAECYKNQAQTNDYEKEYVSFSVILNLS